MSSEIKTLCLLSLTFGSEKRITVFFFSFLKLKSSHSMDNCPLKKMTCLDFCAFISKKRSKQNKSNFNTRDN